VSAATRQNIGEHSNEEQTSETDAPGDGHDFQANRKSNLPPFNEVVSSEDLRDNGIRTAHLDSLAAALFRAPVVASFFQTLFSGSKPVRKGRQLPRADNHQPC
jgi:hypothetical protein